MPELPLKPGDLCAVLHGDCLELLPTLPDNSVHAIITDPPYHLTSENGYRSGQQGDPSWNSDTKEARAAARKGFMGKEWDGGDIAFRPDVWREALRVLKPGGYLLSFGGTRTYHRIACAIEDAGFTIRDSLLFLHDPDEPLRAFMDSLTPAQLSAFIRLLEDATLPPALLGWVYGCLSDDTELLTPEGWVRYDKTKPGNYAMAYDRETGSLSWKPIQEVYAYDYAETAYRLFGKTTDHIVSRNHRCLIYENGRYVFRRAEQLPGTVRVPVVENLCGLLDSLPPPEDAATNLYTVLRRKNGGAKAFSETSGDASRRPYPAGTNARRLRRLRKRVHAEHQTYSARKKPLLFQQMQRSDSGRRMEGARAQRACGMETGITGTGTSAHDRREQSCVEGRRYRVQKARKLYGRSVRPLSCRISADGAQGWVRYGNNRTENLLLFASNREHKLYEHHGSPAPIWSVFNP
jgi:hypothetical protein